MVLKNINKERSLRDSLCNRQPQTQTLRPRFLRRRRGAEPRRNRQTESSAKRKRSSSRPRLASIKRSHIFRFINRRFFIRQQRIRKSPIEFWNGGVFRPIGSYTAPDASTDEQERRQSENVACSNSR